MPGTIDSPKPSDLLGRGRVLEYQFEGNNTISSTIDVTLATPPDLQVTEVFAPTQRARRSIVRRHVHGEELGRRHAARRRVAWDDLVYLSRDPFLDLRADRYPRPDTPRGRIGRPAAATAKTRSYRAPSGFDDETEEYYVFVITDPARNTPTGDVFELNAETNNDRHTATPVIFELPPPTDLAGHKRQGAGRCASRAIRSR